MNVHAKGRIQDDPVWRAAAASTRSYVHKHRLMASAGASIMQPLGYQMDQKAKGSCVGKSYQGRLNALLGVDPSGVGLWTLGRAFDGTLADPTVGTMPASVIKALLENGWGPRHDGEDDRPSSEDMQLPSLDDELAGFDDILNNAFEHFVVVGTDAQIISGTIDALSRTSPAGFSHAVSFGTGVLPPFEDPPPDTVLDETYLSGDSDAGHEQGLLGFFADRNAFLVHGSWGSWTYCNVIVNGKTIRCDGCFLAAPSVIAHAYAVDVLRVR
jgi:hypothetical protein